MTDIHTMTREQLRAAADGCRELSCFYHGVYNREWWERRQLRREEQMEDE